MEEIKLTLNDIKKVIENLSDDENKFELEQLMMQLESEIDVQNQFVEGTSDYLLKSNQLDKAREHALTYSSNKQHEQRKQEKKIFESRGMKAPTSYTNVWELDFYFDDIKKINSLN